MHVAQVYHEGARVQVVFKVQAKVEKVVLRKKKRAHKRVLKILNYSKPRKQRKKEEHMSKNEYTSEVKRNQRSQTKEREN